MSGLDDNEFDLCDMVPLLVFVPVYIVAYGYCVVLIKFTVVVNATVF